MTFLRDAPLQRKITMVTMFVTMAALMLALVAHFIVENWEYRRSFMQELRSIAAITGGNSAAALEFLDEEAATSILAVLEADERLVSAVIFDAQGRAFARYGSLEPMRDLSRDRVHWLAGRISVEEPIYRGDKQVGSILLVANSRELLTRLKEYGAVSLLIGVLSGLAAYLLSRNLRQIVSRPILQLAAAAREVSQRHDYSLRVTAESRDETGELINQFNAMLQTIEEASRNLEASERQLRTITDSLPVLIAYVDSSMRYRFANAAYTEWFGRAREELKNLTVRELVGEEAFTVVEPYFRRVLEGETVRFDAEMNYRSAGRRYVTSTFIPDRREDGRVRGCFVLVMDITERREAEAERERLLESERSARGDAERASRLKDEFLAILSHELRTPLNAIVGWSQLLMRGQRTPEQVAEGVAVIERNARVQSALIADLLDLSRITSGKLSLNMEEVDLVTVTRAAMDAVSMAARTKQIRLELSASENSFSVFGDAARLQQVVWNLLSNSIKFTPSGGRVEVRICKDPHDNVELAVSDTGQGIPKSFIPYVFERFRQADSSTTRHHGGLGIGLSLVKQLVEHHGGSVAVESAGEGMGATFTVRLPGYNPASGQIRAGGEVSQRLDDISVLVVDDEPDALVLIKQILEDAGARVTLAESAGAALDLLQSERPGVLVSDIGMPVHDGYELIKKVRALPAERGGQVPALALTAFARPEDRQRALNAGFQNHLAKPVNGITLIRAIAALAEPRADSAAAMNG